MFAKVIAVVLSIGACAGALLSMRQARLQVASELAQAQLRIAGADDQLWGLRTQIATRITPSNVEQLAAVIGPLRPIIDPQLIGPDLSTPLQVEPALVSTQKAGGEPRMSGGSGPLVHDAANESEIRGPIAKANTRVPSGRMADRTLNRESAASGKASQGKAATSHDKTKSAKPTKTNTARVAKSGTKGDHKTLVESPIRVARAGVHE